jgi:hypothetical protein
MVIQRLGWLLMTITPALATAVLMECLGVRLNNFTPARSDEVGYYLQINAFVHRGFSAGYFTVGENPAPASFSHFGVHGPLYPMLYGSLGKLLGWHFQSGPIFHVILLTLAIAIYCLVVQPTVWQSLLGTATLATFWPFYLCVLSVLQDPVHWAIAILVAAGFCGMLRSRPWADRAIFRLLFLGVLVYASLMRISWAMFLAPYLLLQLKPVTRGRLCLAILLSATGIGLLLYCFRWTCAPYVGSSEAFLMNKVAGGEASAQTVFLHVVSNLERLVKRDLSNQAMLLGSVIFWQALGFGCLMALSALKRLLTCPAVSKRPDFQAATVEVWFHVFNIWALMAGIILFYFVSNDGGWRMLAVHLLLSSFIALTSTIGWLKAVITGIVLVNVAVLPGCAASIDKINSPRFQYGPVIRRFNSQMAPLIQYREGEDPWWNTILIGQYPVELLALPAGIGVSFYGNQPGIVSFPIKSRYVLARPQVVKRNNWKLIELAHFEGLHDSIDYPPPRLSASLYLNPATPDPRSR